MSWWNGEKTTLYTSKTKETIVNFRKSKIPVDSLTINGAAIDAVDCFKVLGTTISNTLGWDAHVEVTEESTATTFLPPSTQKIWSTQKNSDPVLQIQS